MFKFMEKGKCFATDVAVVFGVLLVVDSLHMFVNISRAKLLLTQLTLFSLGLWSQVPLNVVLEILYFVDSSIAEWTLESRHRVVDERVLPISIDSKTDFLTNWTLTRNRVALLIRVWHHEARITVSDMVSDKVCNAGQLHLTSRHIALSAPAMVMLHMTHHIAVISKTLLTLVTLKGFLNAGLFSRLFSNDDNAIIVLRRRVAVTFT